MQRICRAGRVAALLVPGGLAEGSGMPRSEIDAYTQFVGIYGAKGLAYIRVNDISKGAAGLQSPIVKNLTDEAIRQILERTGAKNGDLIFFGADKARIVNDALGALRNKIGYSDFGHAHGLFEDGWKPLWVVDFPMFEYDEGKIAGSPAIIRLLPRRTVMKISWKAIRDVAAPKSLRYGIERLGTGRWLDSYPQGRCTEQGIRCIEDQCG